MRRHDTRVLAREVEMRLARRIAARLPSDRWVRATTKAERPDVVRALAKAR
jgi:hypothetical protein